MRLFISSERQRWGFTVFRRLTVMVAVLGVCVVPVACTQTVDTASSTAASTTTVTVTAQTPISSGARAAPSTTSPGTPELKPATSKSLQEMLSRLPGAVGISIAPIGSDEPGVLYGDLPTEVAWSTIKVPLALAAFREHGAAAQPDIELAIVNSDNAAAERLWGMLGTPAQAAAAVQKILNEAGDTTTVVQSRRVRNGFTAFGQTEWSLIEQARFAAQFPCMPESAGILTLMREVGGSQQWGVASIEEAAVKGGWGPQDPGPGYLVRQLAVVATGAGGVAVTMAATPDAGNLDDGTAILDTVARWITENLDQLPTGEC